MPGLVLASTSPYRRTLLDRLGIPFRCRSPQIDEEDWKQAGLSPEDLAATLARAKAESLAAEEFGATLIGSDQVVSVGGLVLGKPGTPELAFEQLRRLAGATHRLFTAFAVLHEGTTFVHTDMTTMRMRELSDPEIERYVASDQPLDCAGSYKLEERGIALFERIDTEDYTAILGLPLIALATRLRQIGYSIP
ncbi:Maf family protein [Singulisphaera rosea]